jgi:PIN domain nuclease of toxin-antitoxin system
MSDAQAERVLLDTHALVWWLAGSELLSRGALAMIENAATIGISPISFWEVSMLQAKGRLHVNKPILRWMNDVLRMARVETVELKPSIAIEAGALEDFHGDPADRLIYATAAAERLVLITKDDKITAYASARSPVVVAVAW